MIRRTTRILLSALFIAFASALIITLLASYFYWQQLIPWAAERWLQQHRWEITEIQGTAPSTKGWQIDSLSLQQTSPTGENTQLHLNGLNLSWDISRLYTEGKLERIELQSADIRLTPTPAETTYAPLDLRPWLSPAIISQLPAADIRLSNLSIRREQAGENTHILTSLSLVNGTLDWQSQLIVLPDYPALEGLTATLNAQLTDQTSAAEPALQLSPFNLDIRHREQPLLSSRGDLSLGDTIRLTAEHRIELQLLISVLQKIPGSGITDALLPWASGTLNIAGTTSLQPDFNPVAPLQSLQPESEQTVSLTIPPVALSETGLANVSGHAGLELVADISLTPQILKLTVNDTRLTVTDLQTPLLNSQKLRLSLQPATGIRVPLADLNNPDLALQMPATVFKLHSQDSAIISGQQPWSVSHQPIQLTTDTFALCIANICPADALKITGTLEAKKVLISHPDFPLPEASLTSQWQLHQESHTADFTQQFRLLLADPLLPGGQQLIRGNSRTQSRAGPPLTTANWQLKLTSLDGAENLIKRYYPDLPEELALNGGSLSHQGALHFENNRLALRLRQRVENLSGQLEQNSWGGLNWQSDFRRSLSGNLRDDGSLNVDYIAAGIPIEQFSSHYQLRPVKGKSKSLQLRLTQPQAQLLGGEVLAEDFVISESFGLNTRLTLKNIQLADVLALEQQEGLTGSGTLQGSIPLNKTAVGFQVTDGRIYNTGTGWIRFRPTPELTALAKRTPGLDTAFKALENLQYSQLNIGVDYQPDGSTRLNTRLKGLNPDWNAGQRIEFGINIEENLLQLIKALQYTNKLTRSLEKRYR
ncbi:intermembrane phospholipid transport protein YdbH family protein [Aliamphritea hakodatensis]|uniref:intermembrane phospholipid transport protein YdbH family protein n=1 Tax=Aliamphritea hakodatensis TaxID=2895352 RepID=UPI0022FD78E1|nr:YdbH domain-containing protein [Aliamphritea hakodatensis]